MPYSRDIKEDTGYSNLLCPVVSQLPNLVFRAKMGCIITTAFLLLISIFVNSSSASELFKHKLHINPWQDDAEFHLFSQMPPIPRLPENEGIKARDAGLFARSLLGKRQCPNGSGYCDCTSSTFFKSKLN